MRGTYFRSTAKGRTLIYCYLPPGGPVAKQALKRLSAESSTPKLPVYYLLPAGPGEDGPYQLIQEKHGLRLQGPEVYYQEVEPVRRRGILWHPWVWLGILLLGIGLALLIGRYVPPQAASAVYLQDGRAGRLEATTQAGERTRAIFLRKAGGWELYLPAPTTREIPPTP
jgi:hypothetical protein